MARTTRPISWIKAARKDFEKFPREAQTICLSALTIAAEGSKADIAKPLAGFGSGILEIALPFRGDAFRVVYAVQIAQDLWVLHAFQKKSTRGIRTPRHDIETDREPIEDAEGVAQMKKEGIEIVRGSGNVFRDFGRTNSDVDQLKATLAAEIIKELDRTELTVRAAHALTGFAAADFSRIRNADLGRFTLDRLMTILNSLGSRVEVDVKIRCEPNLSL